VIYNRYQKRTQFRLEPLNSHSMVNSKYNIKNRPATRLRDSAYINERLPTYNFTSSKQRISEKFIQLLEESQGNASRQSSELPNTKGEGIFSSSFLSKVMNSINNDTMIHTIVTQTYNCKKQ